MALQFIINVLALSPAVATVKKPRFDTHSGGQLSVATAADKDYLGQLVDMDTDEVKRLLKGNIGPRTQGRLFLDMDEECFIKDRGHGAQQDKVYNKSTTDTFNSMSVSIGVEASYGPMTASLKSQFSITSSEAEQVISRQFWAESFVYSAKINSKCLESSYYFQQSHVILGIVREYQGLNTPEPAFTSTESWRSHWSPVKVFFEKYGTHVITEVWFGAKINSFAYKKTKDAMNETTFEAEACVGAQGATASASACAGTSNKSKNSSASSSVKEKHWNRNVTGNFAGAMTDGEAVKQFMEDVSSKADEDQLVAKEEMKPIWEIFRAGMPGYENAARNLETYYKKLYANKGMDYCSGAASKERVDLGWKVHYAHGGKGCICGVDTICRKGDVCIEDDCNGKHSPWGCGRCVDSKKLPFTSCGHLGCDKGEGDCDYDSECKAGLVCGNANCRKLRKVLYGENAKKFAESKLATAKWWGSDNDDCCCAPGQCYTDSGYQRRALLQRSSKGRSTTSTPPSASRPRTTSSPKARFTTSTPPSASRPRTTSSNAMMKNGGRAAVESKSCGARARTPQR